MELGARVRKVCGSNIDEVGTIESIDKTKIKVKADNPNIHW